MAFCFAASFPTAKYIPPRNDHFLRQLKNPNVKPLFGTQIVNSHDLALRSLPHKHQNQFLDGLSCAAEVRNLKRILRDQVGGCWESLDVIDALQRLGIDYHFQHEIDAILQRQQYAISAPRFGDGEIDLHKVALRFRLLRQHGYYMPLGEYEFLNI